MLDRRGFLRGSLAVGILSAGCSSLELFKPTEMTDHFRIYAGPDGYGIEAERSLEDLTGLLGHPFHGVIEIWTGGGGGPYATRGMSPTINMPWAYIQSRTDPLVHELVRVVPVSFFTLLNRGLAVVSQRILRPEKRTFPSFGEDIHLAASRVGSPLDAVTTDAHQYIIDGSFVGFLVERYGVERLMDYTAMGLPGGWTIVSTPLRHSDMIVYGKSFDELIREWRDNVQTNPKKRPLKIEFMPQKERRDDDVLRRHKGKVVVSDNRNMSRSGLKAIENDAVEAYEFLSGFFKREPFRDTQIAIHIAGNEPSHIETTGNRLTLKLRADRALRGSYELVGLMSPLFLSESGTGLPLLIVTEYLQSLQTTVGGFKLRAAPNYGADWDRMAKAYIRYFEPLSRLSPGRAHQEAPTLRLLQTGSFGRWVAKRYTNGNPQSAVGMLSRVVNGSSWESVFDASLDTMERGWRQYVNEISL